LSDSNNQNNNIVDIVNSLTDGNANNLIIEQKDGGIASDQEGNEKDSLNSGAPDIQERPENSQEAGQDNPGYSRPKQSGKGSGISQEAGQDEGHEQGSVTLQYVRPEEERAAGSKRGKAEGNTEAVKPVSTQITTATATVAPRPAHRPSELERRPDLKDKIVAYLSAGNRIENVCNLVNITPAAFHEWMARGEGRDLERPQLPIYVDFVDAVRKAQGYAEASRLARIEKAGKGGDIAAVKRTYKTEIGKDGKPVQVLVSEETTYTRPQWQADAWMLERAIPEAWGRRLDINAKIAKMPNEELEKFILEGVLIDRDSNDNEAEEIEEGEE
jgi:hypothetical protein